MSNQKKKQICLEDREEYVKAGWSEALLRILWESVATLLLTFVSLSMFSQVSGILCMDAAGTICVMITVLGVFFFYGWILPRLTEKLAEGDKEKKRTWIGKWLPVLLAAGGNGFYYVRHADALQGGFWAIRAEMAEVYNRLFHANLVIENAVEEEIPGTLCFLVITIFLVLWVLSMVVRRRWPLCIMPVISAAAIMSVGVSPTWMKIFLAATGAFMLTRDTRKMKVSLPSLVTAMAGFVIMGIATGVLFHGAAEEMVSRHSGQGKDFEKRMEAGLRSMASGTVFSRGKDIVNSSPNFKDAKVMTVRMEGIPEGNLYFLEFHGANYDRGTWLASKKEFAVKCKEAGTDAMQASLWLVSSLYENTSMEKLEGQISYQKRFGRNMLLPYAVNGGEIKRLSFRGDTIAQKPRMTNRVTFESLATNDFSGLSRQILAGSLKGQSEEEEAEFWDWHDAYVKETYLSVPGNVRELRLLDEFDDYSYEEENLRRLHLAESVSMILTDTSYSYDWELDPLEAGADPVEYFLNVSHKGYCIHFASAGVLLLRSLGVPARYATGYVVKPSAFEEQDDGSYVASVIDRNGHAWAEIYLDGIGWIPVEMTPGYANTAQALPTSQKAREKAQKTTPDEFAAQESSESLQEPEIPASSDETAQEESNEKEVSPEQEFSDHSLFLGEGNATDRESRWLPGVILLLLIVLLLGGILFYHRDAKGRQIKEAIRGKRYRTAVMLLNRRIYQMLRAKKILRGDHPTDKDLEKAMISLLGEESADQVSEYARVAKAAAFSRNPVTKKELSFVWRTYGKIKNYKMGKRKCNET